MKLVANGSPFEASEGISVRELLKQRQVKLPDMVSVELNETIVERAAFDTTLLAEGDRVELLYFMGGGRGSL
ncbi:MAG TPA: sulfur carrier protein ThiS [Polyangia bacterium]|jgi:thiamine biosynthesis protein ThiS|nr:sulfur carrier protein ThiS [Polyangia bacterium]